MSQAKNEQRRSEKGYKLGHWVRRLREQRGMTQQEVAQKAGVSAAFLSQLENEKKDASGVTMQNIAAALGIDSMTEFFYLVERTEMTVHRKSDQIPRVGPEEPIQINYVGPRLPNFSFHIMYAEVETGYFQDHIDRDPCDEAIIVIEGKLGVMLEGKEFELGPGDSCFFARFQSHRIRNLSDNTTKIYLIGSDPHHGGLAWGNITKASPQEEISIR